MNFNGQFGAVIYNIGKIKRDYAGGKPQPLLLYCLYLGPRTELTQGRFSREEHGGMVCSQEPLQESKTRTCGKI